MIKVGIIGGSGYTGVILAGLVLRHPEAELAFVASESHKNEKLSDVYPHLKGIADITYKAPDIDKIAKEADVVFLALPNGKAMNIAPKILDAGAKVIDLSADYRFKDAYVFKEWYKMDHSSKDLLSKAVYGLPEIEKVSGAKLVANPGCYATASILGLYPLIKEGLIDKNSVIVDAKSGVSGAGKSPTDDTHFPNCNEGISAYKVASHRHTPEIEQELGGDIKISFTPHLVPMTRGILATIYAKASKPVDEDKLINIYKEFYKGKTFVRVLEGLPSTKYVYGTNYCDIAVKCDKRTNNIIVLSAIDNLVKGASGQAVQNMNIMFGLPETAGLELIAVYP
ncbi:MAG: N-acetyl-gamma-glutamyl-phosphate reductase [bacterium]